MKAVSKTGQFKYSPASSSLIVCDNGPVIFIN